MKEVSQMGKIKMNNNEKKIIDELIDLLDKSIKIANSLVCEEVEK